MATLLPLCTHHPGDKAEALDMYSRGVTELEKGINMDITAKGTLLTLLFKSTGILEIGHTY